MSAREILTLQFGHYSNFVGTHWWNLQESSFRYDPDSPSEINHDVLFREGLTLKNEVTFTPRLLLVDLKGSLKTVSEHGELYKLPQEETDNENLIKIQTDETPTKNSFRKDLDEFGKPLNKDYDLDSEVQVWSDFLYTRFHPRTVNIIKEYQHNNPNTLFDIYPLGKKLWQTQQFNDDFSDKIRNYIEECDNFQGFHILNDAIDGFSGLSTSCLEHLNDEYNTKSVLGFPVISCVQPEPIQLLNLALNFDALTEHSSLFVPLSVQSKNFNFVSFQPELPYHSSAILASALDTFTLNHRLKTSKHSLMDLCSEFSTYGRKAAAASLCLPFPLKKNEDFIDCLDNWEGPLTQSITPNCEIEWDDSLQLTILRGIPEQRLKRPPQTATKQRQMPAYKCNDLTEMLSYYMACTSYHSKTEVMVCHEQLPVKIPYPKFFNGKIDKNGDVDLNSSGNNTENINILAGLHNGKFVGTMLDVFSEELEKIKYKRFYQFQVEGLENDEFKECFDRILDLRDCYRDNYLL